MSDILKDLSEFEVYSILENEIKASASERRMEQEFITNVGFKTVDAPAHEILEKSLNINKDVIMPFVNKKDEQQSIENVYRFTTQRREEVVGRVIKNSDFANDFSRFALTKDVTIARQMQEDFAKIAGTGTGQVYPEALYLLTRDQLGVDESYIHSFARRAKEQDLNTVSKEFTVKVFGEDIFSSAEDPLLSQSAEDIINSYLGISSVQKVGSVEVAKGVTQHMVNASKDDLFLHSVLAPLTVATISNSTVAKAKVVDIFKNFYLKDVNTQVTFSEAKEFIEQKAGQKNIPLDYLKNKVLREYTRRKNALIAQRESVNAQSVSEKAIMEKEAIEKTSKKTFVFGEDDQTAKLKTAFKSNGDKGDLVSRHMTKASKLGNFASKAFVAGKVIQKVTGSITSAGDATKNVEKSEWDEYFKKADALRHGIGNAKGLFAKGVEVKEGVKVAKSSVKTAKAVARTTARVTKVVARAAGQIIKSFASALAGILASTGVVGAIVIAVIAIIIMVMPIVLYGGLTHLAADASLSDIYAYVTKQDASVTSFIANEIPSELPGLINNKDHMDLSDTQKDWTGFSWANAPTDRDFYFYIYDKLPYFDDYHKKSCGGLYTDPNVLIAYLSSKYGDNYSYPFVKRYDKDGKELPYVDIRKMIEPLEKGTIAGHSYITIKPPKGNDIVLSRGGKPDDYLYNIQYTAEQHKLLDLIYNAIKNLLVTKQECMRLEMSAPEYKVREYLGYSGYNHAYENVKEEIKKMQDEIGGQSAGQTAILDALSEHHDNYTKLLKDMFNTIKDEVDTLKDMNKQIKTITHLESAYSVPKIVNCRCTVNGKTITCTVSQCDPSAIYFHDPGHYSDDITNAWTNIQHYGDQIKHIKGQMDDDYNDTYSSVQSGITYVNGIIPVYITDLTGYIGFVESYSTRQQALAKDITYSYLNRILKSRYKVDDVVQQYLQPFQFAEHGQKSEKICCNCYNQKCDLQKRFGGQLSQAQNALRNDVKKFNNEEDALKKMKDKFKKLFVIDNFVFVQDGSVISKYATVDASALPETMNDITRQFLINNYHGNVLANYLINNKILSGDALENFVQVYSKYGFLFKEELYVPNMNNEHWRVYHRFGYFFDPVGGTTWERSTSESTGGINPIGTPKNDKVSSPDQVDPKGFFSTGKSVEHWYNKLFDPLANGFLDDNKNWYNKYILYKGVVLVTPDFFDDNGHHMENDIYAPYSGNVVYDQNNHVIKIINQYGTSEKGTHLNSEVDIRGINTPILPPPDKNGNRVVDSNYILGKSSIYALDFKEMSPIYSPFMVHFVNETDVYTYKNPLSYITIDGSNGGEQNGNN
jgi:hypothetical protein